MYDCQADTTSPPQVEPPPAPPPRVEPPSPAPPPRVRAPSIDAQSLARASAYCDAADALAAPRLFDGAKTRARSEARAARLYRAAFALLAPAGGEGGRAPGGLRGLRRQARRALWRARLARWESLWRRALPYAMAALAAACIVVLSSEGLRARLWRHNVAAGKAWRASEPSYGGAASAGLMPRRYLNAAETDTLPPFLFHTSEQDEPWVEIDLGGQRRVSGFWVENRRDCCQDRALPLVFETSVDRVSWVPALRRRGMFVVWAGWIPTVTARYVRLRSERRTSLHLRRVAVY
jgi:F5/8 type C domain-containing protein